MRPNRLELCITCPGDPWSSCRQLQLLPGSQAPKPQSQRYCRHPWALLCYRQRGASWDLGWFLWLWGPQNGKKRKNLCWKPHGNRRCWRFPDASNCHIFPKTIKHMSQGISLVHCNKFRVTAAGALPGDSANGNTRQYDRFLSNGRLVLQQNLHRRSDAFAFRWSCQELSTNHDFWVLD